MNTTNASTPTVPPIPRTVIQMFDQGYWWRTRDEEWMPISSMTPEHRYSAARLLERNALMYQLRYEQAQLALLMRFGGPDDADWFEMQLPEPWLRVTALYRALEAGLPTRGKKRRQLAARARHWSSCPLRLRRKNRATDAICNCKETRAGNTASC